MQLLVNHKQADVYLKDNQLVLVRFKELVLGGKVHKHFDVVINANWDTNQNKVVFRDHVFMIPNLPRDTKGKSFTEYFKIKMQNRGYFPSGYSGLTGECFSYKSPHPPQQYHLIDVKWWIEWASTALPQIMSDAEVDEDAFHRQEVLVVGAGGTGSALVEQLAKTNITQISIVDYDKIEMKNVQRLAGFIRNEHVGMPKAQYLAGMVNNSLLTPGVIPYDIKIQEFNDWDGIKFVFIAVDNNEAREYTKKLCDEHNIPYVDLGISMINNSYGQLSYETRLSTKNDKSVLKPDNNEYAKNMQSYDINSINALDAIIVYKEKMSLYQKAQKFEDLVSIKRVSGKDDKEVKYVEMI